MSDSSSSFEWIQFLTLAEKLHDSAATDTSLAEAKYRTVVGRAYYAAFNMAKQYLESQKILVSKFGTAHAEVRECFKQIYKESGSQNTIFSTVANNLDNLRKQRNRADYKINADTAATNYWKKESEKAIKRADKIIKAVELLDKKEKQQDKPGLKDKPILKPKK